MPAEESAEKIVRILATRPVSCAVIDRDHVFRTLFSQVLDDLGFLVYGFDNSYEFLRKNKEGRFDIVILSWNSKPISGMKVVERIRRNGEPYPSLIIGCEGGESVSLQLALAPIGFLFKPFDAQHLMTMLLKALGE
jgi:DNA-binding NtrC family response regulator